MGMRIGMALRAFMANQELLTIVLSQFFRLPLEPPYSTPSHTERRNR